MKRFFSRNLGGGNRIPHSMNAVDDALSLQADDAVEQAYFRRFLLVVSAALLVMLFFFLMAFFFVVRGAEKTVIPRVVDMKIYEALQNLQERELYPRLQLKYTGNPADKGLVISQKPQAGLYVKAGRRITITVSQGAVIDNVENYVGRSITDVQSRLASLFVTTKPLLVIRTPITYVYNDASPGTVISQSPSPGTPLSEPVDLILIVSRGTTDKSIVVPNLIGRSVLNAIKTLVRQNIGFVFNEDKTSSEKSSFQITNQSPSPSSEIEQNKTIQLMYSPPITVLEDYQYGLFNYALPEYQVPVLVTIILNNPSSGKRELFTLASMGGRITFPYIEPVGTEIVLSVNGETAYRLDVVSDSP